MRLLLRGAQLARPGVLLLRAARRGRLHLGRHAHRLREHAHHHPRLAYALTRRLSPSRRGAPHPPHVRAARLRGVHPAPARAGAAAAVGARLRAGSVAAGDAAAGGPVAADHLQEQRRRAAAGDAAAPLPALPPDGGAGHGDAADRGGGEGRQGRVHRLHSLPALRLLRLGLRALGHARGGAANAHGVRPQRPALRQAARRNPAAAAGAGKGVLQRAKRVRVQARREPDGGRGGGAAAERGGDAAHADRQRARGLPRGRQLPSQRAVHGGGGGHPQQPARAHLRAMHAAG